MLLALSTSVAGQTVPTILAFAPRSPPLSCSSFGSSTLLPPAEGGPRRCSSRRAFFGCGCCIGGLLLFGLCSSVRPPCCSAWVASFGDPSSSAGASLVSAVALRIRCCCSFALVLPALPTSATRAFGLVLPLGTPLRRSLSSDWISMLGGRLSVSLLFPYRVFSSRVVPDPSAALADIASNFFLCCACYRLQVSPSSRFAFRSCEVRMRCGTRCPLTLPRRDLCHSSACHAHDFTRG